MADEQYKTLRPRRECMGRVGERRCRKDAVAKRDTHPRFVCASCLKKLSGKTNVTN